MEDRTAFRNSMEAELHKLEAELDQWQVEDEGSGAVQRQREQQQMLDDLHEKRLQARQYLDQVARSDDWAALKSKMETLWADIETQINTIKAWA